MNIIKSLFGYWEVWHVVLATWLFIMVYFARFPFGYFWKWIGRRPHKQITTIFVLAVAIIWELIEWQTGQHAYSGIKHFILNSYKDMLAAILGIVFCIFFLPWEEYDGDY